MITVAREFGGLRPAARFVGYGLLGMLGSFRRDRRVDWSRVRRLVFVCSGNICRSPYGEKLARLRGVEAISFGIHANGIAPADPTALRVARQRDVDLSDHVSTRACDYEPSPGDLLLAMEPWQLAPIRAQVHAADVQVSLLGLWGKRMRPYLPDPFGQTDDCFRLVFSFVDAAVDAIAERLRQPQLVVSPSVTDEV